MLRGVVTGVERGGAAGRGVISAVGGGRSSSGGAGGKTGLVAPVCGGTRISPSFLFLPVGGS